MKRIEKILEFDNVLIISNQVVKDKLIDYFSTLYKLKNITYKTPNEVVRDLLGEYDILARIKLAKELNISPELASIKLKNSLLTSNCIKSNNQKIQELIKIKNDYAPYLHKNELIENLYKDKKIFIINIFNTSDEFKIALDMIQKINSNIEMISTYEEIRTNLEVLEFINYKEELQSILKNTASLIEAGVSPDNIKLQIPENLINYAKEIFTYANISLNLNDNTPLLNYEITKNILKELFINLDLKIDEAFLKVIKKYNSNNPILDKIIYVFNSYLKYDLKVADIYLDLEYKLKHTYFSKTYLGGIKVCNIFDEKLDINDHIFIASFNQDEFPKTFKDEEYLLDYEREELGLLLSKDKNKVLTKKLIHILKSIKNLNLSYAANLPLSSLASFERLNIDVSIKKKSLDYNLSYSEKLDIIALGKHLDLFYKYDVLDQKLYTLYNSYPSNLYKKYDNSFKGVAKEFLKEFFKNGITLSFTAIDKYYKCEFLFYLENVLKIRRSTNDEALFIGNLIHHLLYLVFKETSIPNLKEFLEVKSKEYLESINQDVSKRDEFFISQYIDTLCSLFTFIKEQESSSEFKIFGLEKEFFIDLDFEVPVKLNGKIDKVLTLDIEKTKYAIVVDYKSGNTDFDLNRIVYGINMQIMFYFYFLNNYSNEKFEFAGGYLQGVMPNSTFLYDPKRTYLEQLNDYFKLEGYSSSNIEILKKIDRNIEFDSKFINGIRFKKDNTFHANTLKRVLSKSTFDKLLKLTEEKIMQATRSILDGKFAINPKLIGKKIDSCEYCPYKDICYRNSENYENLEEYKEFEFLEENNDSN